MHKPPVIRATTCKMSIHSHRCCELPGLTSQGRSQLQDGSIFRMKTFFIPLFNWVSKLPAVQNSEPDGGKVKSKYNLKVGSEDLQLRYSGSTSWTAAVICIWQSSTMNIHLNLMVHVGRHADAIPDVTGSYPCS